MSFTGELFDVVVVGSANIDLVSRVPRLPLPGQTLAASGYAEHAGGKGLNQAVACARMGARTAFIGCTGDDPEGLLLRGVLVDEGVDISRLRTVDSPTGRAFINVDEAGENTIVVVTGANDQVGENGAVNVPPCRVLLTQLEIPLPIVADALKQGRAHGAVTVLDPAPACGLPGEIPALCDFVTPNESEAADLGGVSSLLGSGAGSVVLTLGQRGALLMTHSMTLEIDPHEVTAVDTVGAGDAFVGAMCAELARGASPEEACRVAVVAGALATTVHGAVASLPGLADVRHAMESGAHQRK